MSGRAEVAPRVVLVPSTVHGRTLVGGSAGPRAPLLLGFHGYAENAERNFSELSAIPGLRGWALASVQALHPFYTRSQEIVASWMTRQDREQAIEDNIAYIRAVVGRLRADGLAGERIACVGFSQGTAMAWRAAARSLERAEVVALAGDVPPELAVRDLSGIRRALIGRGTEDAWYDEAKQRADLDLLRAKGVAVEVSIYEGGHEWTDDFRAAVASFLAG